jgi:peptide/nickel transport system substrate-binding protein
MKNFVLFMIIFVLAVGCGGSSTGEPLKNQVVIGFPAIPAHFDPLLGFGGGHDTAGVKLLFSTLVETDADMNIVPDLALGYTIGEDALTYTFELRPDARFSDGTAVTAADVVFTYETLMNSATSIDLASVENVSAQGNTVTITLKRPQSTFIFTVAATGIVPISAYGDGFGLNPVGSGPFKLVQYDVDQQFILEANEFYYGQAPEISRVVFVRLANEDISLAAVRSGTVDVAISNAVLAGLGDVDGYNLLVAESLDNMGIVMPVVPDTGEVNEYGHPVGNNVTSDVNLRKALAYGLCRETIGRGALGGFATPAFTENDGMPWSNPESIIGYDLEYALGLLEESGWTLTSDNIRAKGELRAAFTLLYPAGDSVRQAVAMAAAQQAREKLGIEIITEGVSWDALGARMFSTPLILAWGSTNPMTSFYLFHSSYSGQDNWYNPQNFRSSVVDSYLEQAIGAASMEDAIPYFQKAQWDGSNGTSMRGDCPYVFLINRTHLYPVRDGLDTGRRHIHAHGDSWQLVQNLREWKWTGE